MHAADINRHSSFGAGPRLANSGRQSRPSSRTGSSTSFAARTIGRIARQTFGPLVAGQGVSDRTLKLDCFMTVSAESPITNLVSTRFTPAISVNSGCSRTQGDAIRPVLRKLTRLCIGLCVNRRVAFTFAGRQTRKLRASSGAGAHWKSQVAPRIDTETSTGVTHA